MAHFGTFFNIFKYYGSTFFSPAGRSYSTASRRHRLRWAQQPADLPDTAIPDTQEPVPPWDVAGSQASMVVPQLRTWSSIYPASQRWTCSRFIHQARSSIRYAPTGNWCSTRDIQQPAVQRRSLWQPAYRCSTLPKKGQMIISCLSAHDQISW